MRKFITSIVNFIGTLIIVPLVLLIILSILLIAFVAMIFINDEGNALVHIKNVLTKIIERIDERISGKEELEF